MALIHDIGVFFLLLLVGLAYKPVLLPSIGWIFKRSPSFSRPHVAPSAISVALVFIAYTTAHFGLASVHLDVFIALVGLGAVFLFALVLHWCWPRVSRRVGTACAAVFLCMLIALPIGPWREAHNRFVLYNHTPVAGSIAAHFRNLVDFDGDGASPTWLGGSDCAEFDPNRGPAQREIVGDGIDQDCRGGDGKALSVVQKTSRSIWPDCHPAPAPLSVILITIEAWRTESFTPKLMPQLSNLARQAALFTRAYTTAAFTDKSVLGFLTGRPVSSLGSHNLITDPGIQIDETFVTRLRRGGYRTAMDNHIELPPEIKNGFDEVNTYAIDASSVGSFYLFSSRRTSNAGVQFLKRAAANPYFLWLHYTDTHAPYLPLGDTRFKPGEVSDYERIVSYVDNHVGQFLREMDRLGLTGRTAIFITGDHGEDLGIRGREGHGQDLFEDTIHVPLIAWIPGCRPRLIKTPVSLSQLGPTLQPLTGVEIPGNGLFVSASAPASPVVSETLYNEGKFPPQVFKRAVIGPRYKLIQDVRNGGRMAFDLLTDPGETQNIHYANPKVALDLEKRYQRWLDRPLSE
jgi:arylsulfatase A-like enzyme